jgi:GT2 family glycosyltransferase
MDRVHAVNSNDEEGATVDGGAAELDKLRNQVVAQAKELAMIRWEISSLVRQHPISGRVTQAKYSVLRRFPKVAHRIGKVRRASGHLLRSLRRPRDARPTPGITVETGPLGSLRRPILLVGESAITKDLLNATPTQDVLLLEHGAGFTRSFSVPQADEPPLRAPADGSFAKWLSEDAGRVRKFGTIVVDAGDAVSLGLLRGRLSEGQTLVLTNPADASAVPCPLVAELGRPDAHDARTSCYTRLPPAWLDPLDSHGRPIPAVVARQAWPSISVVMVSFNQAAFLEEGLRSVLEQGYPNLQFIVIDGNSTDGSVEILERYRSRLADLVIEPDRGQSDGLNKGFARVTGDILTWVNSDDLLEPSALFRVAQAFATPGVDMVAGGCRQIGLSRDQIILNHHSRLPMGIPIALPLGLLLDVNRFWFTGSFFYQPEVFFSRDIWRRSGGKLRTDLNYVLDYDLWVRMAAAGAHILQIPEFLACSRTHDQQKTTFGSMPYMPEIHRLVQEYSSRLVSPA